MAQCNAQTVESQVQIPSCISKNFIGGQWVPSNSGKTLDVFSPASGKVIAQVADSDEVDVDNAVKAAREAFDKGPWYKGMTPLERQRILLKIADLLIKYQDELGELESMDNGVRADFHKGLIGFCSRNFEYMAGWCTKSSGHTISLGNRLKKDFHAYTEREPYGVVAAITPWNGPMCMACLKLAPALAAGNCIVLKPPELAPMATTRFGEILTEAGLPDGVVNIINGYGASAGNALSLHDKVDMVSFTGSTATGKKLIHNSAGNMKKLNLELGGKSPHIIFADAENVDLASRFAAMAVMGGSGQVCYAGSRLYVEEPIYEQVLAGVKNFCQTAKLGVEPDSLLGPLISQFQLEKVQGLVQSGIDQGAKVEYGGTRHGDEGYYFTPTILSNVNSEMKVVQEEIFGPVVCVQPFKTIEEVTEKANNTYYGLASGIWTKDIKKAHRTAQQIQAGAVWINCYGILDVNLPFGGYKQSGWGRQLGQEGFEEYLQTKSVVCGL